MRLGRLDMNLLVALDHLLDLRSITQAANKMHLTQSAMSSALRRLREYFEDPLLVQIGREMELTARAEALKEPLRDILVQLEGVLSAGLSFDASQSQRQFRLIVSDYTLAVFAPHLLALAEEEGATTRFKFLPQVKSPQDVIERGDADFLITPELFLSPEHPSEPLFNDSFVAAVWSGGRHAAQPISFEQYIGAKHVVMVPETDIANFQSDFMARMGILRAFEVESYNFVGLAPLVVGTDRIATVHGQLGRSLARAYPLVIHPLPFQAPRIQEHLQWHRQRAADPGIIWLRTLAQRAVERLADAEA